MVLIGFSIFYQYSNGSLADSYCILVFRKGKKKKVKIRFDTSDVINSLGLDSNCSPEIIENELSRLIGRFIVFHRFSVLSF